MEPVMFNCRRSLLARVWVISVHVLFAIYLVSLPLASGWSIALPAFCLYLAFRDYRKHATDEVLLVYQCNGRWRCSGAGYHGRDSADVKLRIKHRNPLVLLIDVQDGSTVYKGVLAVWRDTLNARQWRELIVYLSF